MSFGRADYHPDQTLPDKKDVIAKLKKAAKEADVVYLAPDPDREGEAIAWHIAEILPKSTNIKRTTFNSITKEAVLEVAAFPAFDGGEAAVEHAERGKLFGVVTHKNLLVEQRKPGINEDIELAVQTQQRKGLAAFAFFEVEVCVPVIVVIRR